MRFSPAGLPDACKRFTVGVPRNVRDQLLAQGLAEAIGPRRSAISSYACCILISIGQTWASIGATRALSPLSA